MASICHVEPSRLRGAETDAMPGSEPTRSASARTSAPWPRPAVTARRTGLLSWPGKSRASWSPTVRALRPSGSVRMSTGVQTARRAGNASTTITRAVTAAMAPGRRMTDMATEYQRASARRERSRAASLTFQSAKKAGVIRHEAAAATRATPAPPMAMD